MDFWGCIFPLTKLKFITSLDIKKKSSPNLYLCVCFYFFILIKILKFRKNVNTLLLNFSKISTDYCSKR